LYEPNNPFDAFAIKVCEEGKSDTVGHLPKEISCATKFFIDRGATIKATLISEHYRRSPLVQGGMEIACKTRAVKHRCDRHNRLKTTTSKELTLL